MAYCTQFYFDLTWKHTLNSVYFEFKNFLKLQYLWTIPGRKSYLVSSSFSNIFKKIVLEPLRDLDAKWLFLESLKYIYMNHSRKIMEFIWFYWNAISKCTWVIPGHNDLHPFPGVAQVQFFWVYTTPLSNFKSIS